MFDKLPGASLQFRQASMLSHHWNNLLRRRRRGSVLIMVLVVMMVVGMIATQTNQLLVAYQSSDRQVRAAEQSRELIELGIVRARQALEKDDQYRGETVAVEVWDSLRTGGASPVLLPGRIQIEVLHSDSANSAMRITVTYPVGLPGELVSKWESLP